MHIPKLFICKRFLKSYLQNLSIRKFRRKKEKKKNDGQYKKGLGQKLHMNQHKRQLNDQKKLHKHNNKDLSGLE